MNANKAYMDFTRIPEWKDDKEPHENFVILKDISPIPLTRLENWEYFEKFLKAYNKKPFQIRKQDLIFRGQSKSQWKLTPNLHRLEFGDLPKNILQAAQLESFRQAIRGRINDYSLLKETLEPEDENELWSIGQHHGLMTPLLDWTFAPYVALFFAFMENHNCASDKYRAIYVLNRDILRLSDFNEIHVVQPRKDEHGRLVNQKGLFTRCYSEEEIEKLIADFYIERSKQKVMESTIKIGDINKLILLTMVKSICKVYIKNEDREGCLERLQMMNIDHANLFPDLHGAAESCNSKILNRLPILQEQWKSYSGN